MNAGIAIFERLVAGEIKPYLVNAATYEEDLGIRRIAPSAEEVAAQIERDLTEEQDEARHSADLLGCLFLTVAIFVVGAWDLLQFAARSLGR